MCRLLRHSIVYCDGRDYRSDDPGDWREPIPENFCVRFDQANSVAVLWGDFCCQVVNHLIDIRAAIERNDACRVILVFYL